MLGKQSRAIVQWSKTVICACLSSCRYHVGTCQTSVVDHLGLQILPLWAVMNPQGQSHLLEVCEGPGCQK